MNAGALRSTALCIGLASALAGCSTRAGSDTAGLPLTSPQSKAASLARPSKKKRDQMMYLADEGHNAILGFAPDANGNIAPSITISGSNTQLDKPIGMTVDSAGNIYAVNLGNNQVLIFPAGSNGDVSPSVISGYDTKLQYTLDVAVDASGYIYVSEDGGSPGVYVFAPGSTGNVAPIRTIVGSNTGLSESFGMAFDSQNDLYVANVDPSVPTIAEFAPSANGNVPPIGTLGLAGGGGKSGLSGANSVSIGKDGEILVGNGVIGGIDIFKHGAVGDVRPTVVISGPATGIVQLFTVGSDAKGFIYVTNYDGSAYETLVFSPKAKANAAPVRTITGPNTDLDLPYFPTFF